MATDWEDILGGDLSPQAGYDRALEVYDRIEHGWHRPESSSISVINWLPGDRCPSPEDDGLENGLNVIECDGNYPFCDSDCESCLYCRQCDGGYEKCDGNCDDCPYDRGLESDGDRYDTACGSTPVPADVPDEFDSDGSDSRMRQ